MLQISWSSVDTYANNNPATADTYTSSVPAVLLGVLSSSTQLVSLWAYFSTGEVFSAEWVSSSAVPVGRMFNPSTTKCWQAPYSASSGYGAWVESSTGPLGVTCGSVSSAAWYTRASAMSSGANYTGADTISSGYMGIVHMVHQTSDNIVVGGEMDGRTLSTLLVEGKPAEGEIYVVSTSNSQETLISSTEASAQAQLLSSSAVDPGSVGGLTGSSAQTLQSQLGTFASLWSHSESVSMADSHGLVSQRCPSSASNAYVAIGSQQQLFSSQSPAAVQRFNTTSTLQLTLVTQQLPLSSVC